MQVYGKCDYADVQAGLMAMAEAVQAQVEQLYGLQRRRLACTGSPAAAGDDSDSSDGMPSGSRRRIKAAARVGQQVSSASSCAAPVLLLCATGADGKHLARCYRPMLAQRHQGTALPLLAQTNLPN